MDSDSGAFGAGVTTGIVVVMIGAGALMWFYWPHDVSYQSASTDTSQPMAISATVPQATSTTYDASSSPLAIQQIPTDLQVQNLPTSSVPVPLSLVPYPIPQPGNTTLIVTGAATMTVGRTNTVNDMFIGDTQLYSSNGEKYQLLVRAEDSPIKTMHITLPDFYRPVDQSVGGSPLQTAADGSRQLRIRLKHDANVQSDFDAAIFVQSPTITDEADHPLRADEVGDDASVFSMVSGGLSVTVEVTHTPKGVIPDAAYTFAKKKLDESILGATIAI